MIRGVLVEGLNFSGKSTLVEILAERLRARAGSVRRGHCYLCVDPLTERLQDRALEYTIPWRGRPFPDPELLRPFNALKSAQMLIDSQLAATAKPDPDPALVVQDRHWFTQWCSNEFFNPGDGLLSREWVLTSAPRFLLHVYLTCAPATRRARAAFRDGPPAHWLNAYLLDHLEELHAFEECCLRRIPDDPSWLVIPTDGLQPLEVADTVVAALDRRMAGSVAGSLRDGGRAAGTEGR